MQPKLFISLRTHIDDLNKREKAYEIISSCLVDAISGPKIKFSDPPRTRRMGQKVSPIMTATWADGETQRIFNSNSDNLRSIVYERLKESLTVLEMPSLLFLNLLKIQ